jgi:hypothetical protein
VTGNEDIVCGSLRASGGDGTDARFCDEFHRDARPWVHFLEVVDELSKILDGFDHERGPQAGASAGEVVMNRADCE